MNEEILENQINETEDIGAPTSAETELPTREELLARISELEEKLALGELAFAAKKAETDELRRIFPEADPDALPDEVVRRNAAGVPLAAAYALYEKLRQLELSAAQSKSQKNANTLNPSISGGSGEPYFSADEVRRMSARQIKENFTSIKRSMKSWANK